MEQFVNQAENKREDEDDDELLEMLYGKEMGDQQSITNYKYNDFFQDENASENEDDDEFKEMKDKLGGYDDEKMPFHLLANDDKNRDEEDYDDEDNEKMEEILKKKSKKEEDDSEEFSKLDPLYAKQKSLKDQIKMLEDENLSKKEWALMGEVSSKSRPLDSLIEKNIEFDSVTRPVPIITEEYTSNLENMIKKRILEEAWDDVVRKQVVNIPYKPQIVLDKEKSEKGLSEIYEQQYKDKMSQVAGKSKSIIDELEEAGNEKLDNFKTEILNDWEKLRYKLDVMSNSTFAPRPPALSIISKKDKNTKAVTLLDQATPTTITESSLIAPQEVLPVQDKPLKSHSELTQEERKQKRKLKKENYKKTKQEHEEKFGKSKQEIEKEVLQERNTFKANKEDTTKYTKSAQVFKKIESLKTQDNDKELKKEEKENQN
eukprot:TRINITY_DN2056_c0_g1_i1.p1 TRINITY_DN2056_c0_g1~~TRINITY_DN2056_c0_g1_i1.p1  ORF type:complete len:431 (-),score=187.97 TRINITY_DN2056_c0_g1_i1:12-1304(-)